MTPEFTSQLTNAVRLVENQLNDFMPKKEQSLVAEPMRHAVLNGGKRLRAFLVLETASLFDVSVEQALHSAAAIECIHAYSLVHDDLPCMDDDDLRRGQPTVHVKWDEATAVLVGDALQTLAFEILSKEKSADSDAIRIKLISSLTKASGANGMVLGQAQDIAAETAMAPLTLDQITDLQANKTGALIKWSAETGAMLANQPVSAFSEYATALGLAFQIQDDVLDIEGDASAAGKRLQKDTDAGKATFVSILGLDAAKLRARTLVEQAQDVLSSYGPKADALRAVAQYVVERDK
jgi:farnesyl diphosphate synthase